MYGLKCQNNLELTLDMRAFVCICVDTSLLAAYIMHIFRYLRAYFSNSKNSNSNSFFWKKIFSVLIEFEKKKIEISKIYMSKNHKKGGHSTLALSWVPFSLSEKIGFPLEFQLIWCISFFKIIYAWIAIYASIKIRTQ